MPSQLARRLGRGALPVVSDEFAGRIVKQVVRQIRARAVSSVCRSRPVRSPLSLRLRPPYCGQFRTNRKQRQLIGIALRRAGFHERIQRRAGLGEKLRGGVAHQPLLAPRNCRAQQTAQPVRSRWLQLLRAQVSVGGDLQGFRLRVRGDDPFAQPFDQGGLRPRRGTREIRSARAPAPVGVVAFSRSSPLRNRLRAARQPAWRRKRRRSRRCRLVARGSVRRVERPSAEWRS